MAIQIAIIIRTNNEDMDIASEIVKHIKTKYSQQVKQLPEIHIKNI